MIPLKLTVLQAQPDATQVDLLINGTHYSRLFLNKSRYICIDPNHDQVSLQTSRDSCGTELWQIDSRTLSVVGVEPQELAIRPNDSLIIRMTMQPVKAFSSNRKPQAQRIEEFNSNTFDAQESRSDRHSSKEQPSWAVAGREKQAPQPSSTIQPSTFLAQSHPAEQHTFSTMPKLDELAQQRQRIINELFGKLRAQCQMPPAPVS